MLTNISQTLKIHFYACLDVMESLFEYLWQEMFFFFYIFFIVYIVGMFKKLKVIRNFITIYNNNFGFK